MHAGATINGQEVLSIHLQKDGLCLRHDTTKIKDAVRSLGWGKEDAKDFLKETEVKQENVFITRKKWNTKACNQYIHGCNSM